MRRAAAAHIRSQMNSLQSRIAPGDLGKSIIAVLDDSV
jgi:hypothetical protein